MQYIAVAVSSGDQVEVPALSEHSDAQVVVDVIWRVREMLMTVSTGNDVDGTLGVSST